MELICRINRQMPLQEREYNTQQGTTEKFASKGFLLQSGGDTLYAEMVQEQARRQGELPQDRYYKVTLTMQARSWNDQQQTEHWENRLTITKIAVL